MVIQYSGYMWMRNCHLIPMIEGAHGFAKLSAEDKTRMQNILDLIEDLRSSKAHKMSHAKVGPYLAVNGYISHEEQNSNPELTSRLFQGLVDITVNYDVSPNLYTSLGRAYKEIGLEMPLHIQAAVDYADNQTKDLLASTN